MSQMSSSSSVPAGTVTLGTCWRSVQDAKTNICQSQVTARLICGEPYFLCLPKDPAGQCVILPF